jgi:hypothetical protein
MFLGLMLPARLEFGGQIFGAEHELLFRSFGLLDRRAFDRVTKQAEFMGLMLNFANSTLSQC